MIDEFLDTNVFDPEMSKLRLKGINDASYTLDGENSLERKRKSDWKEKKTSPLRNM